MENAGTEQQNHWETENVLAPNVIPAFIKSSKVLFLKWLGRITIKYGKPY